MTDYQTMPFDELRTLHREIGGVIAQRRSEELETIKARIASLGLSAEDLGAKKKRGRKKKEEMEITD